MGGKALPYDAEIEYLESDNTGCWIDTGIITNSTYTVELEFYSSGRTEGIFGSRYNYFDKSYELILVSNIDQIRYRCNNSQSQQSSKEAYRNISFNTWNRVKAALNKLYINETLVATLAAADNFVSNLSYYLFALNTAGQGTNLGKKRIRICKIWDGNTLLLDFIPVRKGTVGYMYDKVSGQLFGNAGTGNFVLGSDKT